MVKVVIPFIIGILCGLYIPFGNIYIAFLALGLLLPVLFLFSFRQYLFSFLQRKGIYSSFISLILILLGFFSIQLRDTRYNPSHFGKYVKDKNLIEFVVDDMPVEGTNSIKVVAKVVKIKDSSQQWHQTLGKVIFYLQKESMGFGLNYGDRILAYTVLKEVEPPSNPHQFNYKQYLADKSILYQTYLQPNSWRVIKRGDNKSLFSMAYAMRKKLLKSLKESGLSPAESAIASALLLGWNKEIDPVTNQAFKSAGITHLLCVSGLHVGIIAAVAGYLLFFIGKTKRQRVIRSVLQLLVVWLFAFITGLAPSVQRAALMFSFMIVGQNLFRKSNTYNALAASALCILVVNPYLIRDVGFQLSYIAVLGILVIQPLLKNLVKIRYKVVGKIWELAAVSIAAQLATAPFLLYYFHQFPTYFLLANIIIVPFAAVLLVSVVLVALFSWMPIVGHLFTMLLSWQISGMSYIVTAIEKFPMALISNIHFDIWHAFLLAAIICMFVWAFMYRNTHNLLIAFFLVVVFMGYELYCDIQSSSQKSWVVYNLGSKVIGVEFVSGNRTWLVNDFSQRNTAIENYQFQMSNSHIQKQIREVDSVDISDTASIRNESLYRHGGFIQFDTCKILLFGKEEAQIESSYMPDLDYIVIYNNPEISIGELCKNYCFKTLILSADNSKKRLNKWEKECDSLQIPYYSIASKGAFALGR